MIKTTERKAVMWLVNCVCWLEFVKILIFITVDIFKHTAKKIRKLNEQIKFYMKCMVPTTLRCADTINIILSFKFTSNVTRAPASSRFDSLLTCSNMFKWFIKYWNGTGEVSHLCLKQEMSKANLKYIFASANAR